MQLNDSRNVPASRDKVWAALNDPSRLKQCIPGCQKLEMTSPTDMTATVVIKVEPVKGDVRRQGHPERSRSSEWMPDHGRGLGRVAGFAKSGAAIRLEAAGENETILHYAVVSQIGDKPAQLGGRVIDSAARKLAGEFLTKFGAVVSAS